MAIEEKTLPDQKIAVIKHKGSLDDMEVLIAQLMGWVETEEIEIAGDIFAIYYNNVKRFRNANDVVYDIGIPVADGQKIDDTNLLTIENLLEHKVLAKIHKGDLENTMEEYEKMVQFAEENHYDIIGSPKEVYIKSKYEVENLDDMITEIQLPIIKLD